MPQPLTDLAHHIRNSPLADTHEHLCSEQHYTNDGPDVLRHLFENYAAHDLVVAGASHQTVQRLVGSNDPDVRGRFLPVRDAWERCRHTGYGEAVQLIARHLYGMEDITVEAIEAAAARNEAWRQPGERRRMLEQIAGLDHVQINDIGAGCFVADEPEPDFFLHDISWWDACVGKVDVALLQREVGVTVKDLASLETAYAAIFQKHAGRAVAVKSQHAYSRTLAWRPRERSNVEAVLQKTLRGQSVTEDERCRLGDWSWSMGARLAAEHGLPFKIHTGYYAGYGYMPVDRIRSGQLCELLIQHPGTRFVLMHIAFPYDDELVALAKHFPNVHVDLCWAWSINPLTATDFVRRMIHAVPSNKLFAFGGDALWPGASLAYAFQAREGLRRTLQEEVDEGWLTESAAIRLATGYMHANQEACFQVAGKRSAPSPTLPSDKPVTEH